MSKKLQSTLLIEIYNDGSRNDDYRLLRPKNFVLPPKGSRARRELIQNELNAIAFAFEDLVTFWQREQELNRPSAVVGFMNFLIKRQKSDIAGFEIADTKKMNDVIFNSAEGRKIMQNVTDNDI